MTDKAFRRAPWHLWAIGLVSLLWNGVGATDYVMTKLHSPAYLAMFTQMEMAWMDGFPFWANAAWALGVWGAVAGSLLLLARSQWAVTGFALSLVGIFGTTLYQYALSDMPASFRTPSTMLFCAALWIVAIALYVYARRWQARGVLR